MTGGLLGTGVFLLIMILVPKLPVILSLMIVAGPLLMAWLISLQTVLQKETEDRFRGRVFGAYNAVSTILMFVGSGLGGSLADTLGLRPLMIASAVIYMVAGLLAWLLLRRRLAAPESRGVRYSGL